MAVTKIWAIHDSVSRVVDYCTNPSKTKLSDLEQVLLYAADKEKTLDEGEQQYAVTGIGCRAESAAREMAAVQRRFGKAGGNVAYHAYQSFKTGEVTAEECHRIGVETARRLWGNDRQVLTASRWILGLKRRDTCMGSMCHIKKDPKTWMQWPTSYQTRPDLGGEELVRVRYGTWDDDPGGAFDLEMLMRSGVYDKLLSKVYTVAPDSDQKRGLRVLDETGRLVEPLAEDTIY